MSVSPPAKPAFPSAFHRFWAAAAVSNLGDGVRLAALPLLAVELTDDARLIAGVTAMSFLPWVVAGPISGALVDRSDRRRVMLMAQACRGAAMGLLALGVVGGWVTIWLLYGVSLVVGVGETLVDAAAQAAVPHLVEDNLLERANGRIIAAQTLFDEVVGVAVGGVLYATAPALPLWVDAVSFAVAAVLIASVPARLQRRVKRARSGFGQDIVEGVRYLLGHRLLRGVAISVGVTNVGRFMGMSVLVILVVEELGGSEATYGLVLGVGALGGLMGSALGGRTAERLTPTAMLKLVHIPYILGCLVLGAAASPMVAAGGVFALAYGVVSFKIPSQSIRQRVTPDHLRGRTVTAFRIVGLGGPVIGAAIGGVVTEASGVRTAFVLGAGVMAIGWLLLLRALRPMPNVAL